jgi:hypothetical protein
MKVAMFTTVMLSNRLGVPYPVFLVLGGLALGLVPIVPEIGLPPDLVLLIFLPPLLYSAAFFSSPRDLKANLRPIASLSIGLVLLTTLTVASMAHLLSYLLRHPRHPRRTGDEHAADHPPAAGDLAAARMTPAFCAQDHLMDA